MNQYWQKNIKDFLLKINLNSFYDEK